MYGDADAVPMAAIFGTGEICSRLELAATESAAADTVNKLHGNERKWNESFYHMANFVQSRTLIGSLLIDTPEKNKIYFETHDLIVIWS